MIAKTTHYQKPLPTQRRHLYILQPLHRYKPSRTMCSPLAASTSISAPPNTSHLDEDFTGLGDEQGFMTIAGFGSLLSEASARYTFPDLQDFAVGRVKGFRRMFAFSDPFFYESSIANHDTGEVAGLGCEPWDGSELVVSLFRVPYTPDSVASFRLREKEYEFLRVQPETMDGASWPHPAVMCVSPMPIEEMITQAAGATLSDSEVEGVNAFKLWSGRRDMLPCRVYLRHCVLAAKRAGPQAYDNFVDSTLLADGRTKVREYLEQNGNILEDEVPKALAVRYGGY